MPNLQTLITGSFSTRQVSSPAQPCLKGRILLNESPKSVIKDSAVISPESASSESMDHCQVNDMRPQRCHDQEDLTSDGSSTGSSFKRTSDLPKMSRELVYEQANGLSLKTLLQVGSSEANDPISFLDQKTSSQYEEALSSTSRDSMVSNGCSEAHLLSNSITIGNSEFHLSMGTENIGKTDVPESIELRGFTNSGSENVNKSREWLQDSFLNINSDLELNQTSKLLPGQFLASKTAPHASEAIGPKMPQSSSTEGDTHGEKCESIRQKINASHCSDNENMRTSDSPKSALTRYSKMQDTTSLATQSRARSDNNLNPVKGGRFSPRNLQGKAMKSSPIKPSPSKWDDAQKWLISSISSDIITHPQADSVHISSPKLSSYSHYPNEGVGRNKSSGTDQSLRIFGVARVANKIANKLENPAFQGSPRQVPGPEKNTISSFGYVLKSGGIPEKPGRCYDQKQKPLLEGRTVKVTDAHKLSVVHPSGNSDSPCVAMQPKTNVEAPQPGITIVNLSTEQRASLERINPVGLRGSERLFTNARESRASSNMISHDVHMTDKYADTVVQTPDHGLNSALKDEFFVQTPKLGGSLPMKDVSTEVSPPVSRYRDMGTQMTPLSSSRPSKCTTPISNISPARHNTPAKQTISSAQTNLELLELQSCQLMAKLEHRDLSLQNNFNGLERSTSNTWSTREEEEEESSKSLRFVDLTEIRKSVIEARAAAWEEAEQAKSTSRYKREESKVQAWENHQKAKAEAEMRKLEVKLEKMRSHQTEKIMNKLAAAHRHAENMRAAAQAEQAEQLAKSKERANQMRISGHVPTPFCACFTCRT